MIDRQTWVVVFAVGVLFAIAFWFGQRQVDRMIDAAPWAEVIERG